jgi:spermidine/putrescine transport system ATP-binding protein
VSAGASNPPSGSGAPPVIALAEVQKRFGTVVAVERASFAVRRGEFFSILGPSGCGKTTLLRLIGGFDEPSGGCIRLDGVDVNGVPPYRRNVNTVFQHYALFPHLSVFDNVAFGPRAQGLGRAETERRVVAMLEVVRLADCASRRPAALSGGQRQRVALARALVNFPSALLLDEPLSALDRGLRQQMQGELKRIQRELDVAFVFVTHDQEEALGMSDRLAVMRGGRVEQVGTPEEVYGAPTNAFVAAFLGAANLIAVRVEARHGDRVTVRLPGGGCADLPADGATFRCGDPALVMVRPERIQLYPGNADAPAPGMAVTVVETRFQGPVRRCVLRGEDGLEIVAHLVDGSGPAEVGSGMRVWASWDWGAARLLCADDAGGVDAPPA